MYELLKELENISGYHSFLLHKCEPRTRYANGNVYERKGISADIVKVFNINSSLTLSLSFDNYYAEDQKEVRIKFGFKNKNDNKVIYSSEYSLKDTKEFLKNIIDKLNEIKNANGLNNQKLIIKTIENLIPFEESLNVKKIKEKNQKK